MNPTLRWQRGLTSLCLLLSLSACGWMPKRDPAPPIVHRQVHQVEQTRTAPVPLPLTRREPLPIGLAPRTNGELLAQRDACMVALDVSASRLHWIEWLGQRPPDPP